MALEVKQYQPSNSDQLFENAYLRIQKIVTANLDYEYFENIPGTEDQKLSWMTRLENIATIFVWGDKGARDNRAQILDHFIFYFDCDLSSDENIYAQAYSHLKSKFGDENVTDV